MLASESDKIEVYAEEEEKNQLTVTWQNREWINVCGSSWCNRPKKQQHQKKMFIGCDVNALIDGTKRKIQSKQIAWKNESTRKILMEIGKGHFLYSAVDRQCSMSCWMVVGWI